MEQNHQPQVEVSNARIAATQLGFDGAAMFGTLQLQAQGFGVGFSGHVLHVEAQTQEQADYQTSFGMDYIAQVLRVVGVQHWESLKGQPVRIAREGNQVIAIGNLIEEIWFEPRKLGEQAQEKAELQAAALAHYRAWLATPKPQDGEEQPQAVAGETAAEPEQPKHPVDDEPTPAQ